MEFVLLATSHFLALLSPGADFFLILNTSLKMPRKYGVALCLGIAAANGVYILIALAGHETLRNMGDVLEIMKYLGGGYLIYLGYMLIRAPKRELIDQGTVVVSRDLLKQFMRGFLSGILNPKNILFYLTLFTVFVHPTTPLSIRIFYGVWMFSVVLLWDVIICLLLGRVRDRGILGGLLHGVEKISGVMLAGFGVILAFS